MNPAPTTKEVLTLISEWMDAKKKYDEEKRIEDSKPTPTLHGGWGGVFSLGMNDFINEGGRDDGDEQKVIPDHEQRLIRAQLALDLYVVSKVEETLQNIINQNNERQQGNRPEHELYPERG